MIPTFELFLPIFKRVAEAGAQAPSRIIGGAYPMIRESV